MKIVKLQAENFKRLRAVEITPDGAVVVINGQNGAGKSSVLDSIEAALGGKRSIPGVPIHDGERKARIVLETEDIVVTRKFTQKGSTLEVVAKDGRAYKSPQTMLDRLVGTLSFDPLGFSRQDAKTQQEVLRGIVGLNFMDHDIKRREAYQQRTEVNRDIKRVRAHLEKLPQHRDAPAEEVVVADLMAELSANREHNNALRGFRDVLTRLTEEQAAAQAKVYELKNALDVAEMELDRVTHRVHEQGKLVEEGQRRDTMTLEQQIAGAEEQNRKLAQNRDHERVTSELADLEDGASILSEEIEDLDREKAAKIQAAEFPVEGLGFDEDGVTLNGLPYSQASGAEQLKASVAIGMSLNPELRVLLIRDGSLLDESNLAVLQEMAEMADFQCFVERVGDDGEMGILIEDGMVSDG